MDSSTIVLRNVLGIVTDLGALPHSGQVGRVLLTAAVAGQGKGCNDDAVALAASMPVDQVREIIPTMLVRCLQIPPLLTAKDHVRQEGVIWLGVPPCPAGLRPP